MNLHRTKFRN